MDRVYIIESPSDEDLLENRREGRALVEALKLAEINVNYFLATSQKMFNRAMKFVVEDFYEKKGKWSSMPYIHISAHGDKQGIVLTNGDYYSWEDFRGNLDDINEKIGYVPHFDKKVSKNISRIGLCFSSCEGFNGHKIHEVDPCPFQCLVGPTKSISWPDALTAFQVFYHSTNYKNNRFIESVDLMNNAVGLDDVFKIYVSPELGIGK